MQYIQYINCQYIDASLSGTTNDCKTLIAPPVVSHLTLWGHLGWLLSQQRWSHSPCTQFQTATLQTGTAGSETQSTTQTLSCSQTTAVILCDSWRWDGICGEKDIRISPGTLFWLAHAQWDAAERERSDYPKSPSHRSMLGHPKTWGRIKMQAVNFICSPTLYTAKHINDQVVVTYLSCDDSCLTLSLL